eukprot:TRINITY_DN103_c0_g1_i1.p1 TRINITY_DN103_c0_g1~~TRINITY_DN103_c0_g1_i1.p1  ORF type:complete len:485 (-),score=116.84 TRINITY_DN103_c0_g1_i1:159-1613(-)
MSTEIIIRQQEDLIQEDTKGMLMVTGVDKQADLCSEVKQTGLQAQINREFNVEEFYSGFDIAQFIQNKITEHSIEDPFYVVDLGIIKQKLAQWRSLLPRVETFYAMKCNPHPALIKTLKQFDIGFDCASKGEMYSILEEEGVDASKIIFANPCKPPSHLLYAKQHGVKMMTFDNLAELEKIHKYYPEAQVVLRLLTDDSSSICRFGTKFGAPPHHVSILIKRCIELQLDLIGVSFHVGSGCLSTDAFVNAVKYAHKVFRLAKEMGVTFTLLDIGGGFPGLTDASPHPSFTDIAKVLGPALDELFPASSGVRLIAEPGRFFAAEGLTLAVCVYAKRDVQLERKNMGDIGKSLSLTDASQLDEEEEDLNKPDFLYYVNDGVYGSFNCIMFDHAKVEAIPLNPSGNPEDLYRSVIFGPTCDSMDCIAKDVMLPKIEVGEWMYFKEMGAYTVAAASRFNGFNHPSLFFIDTVGAITPEGYACGRINPG